MPIAEHPRDTVIETALYQVISPTGAVVSPMPEGLTADIQLRMYRFMRLVRILDDRMVKLQRQGRIGFYGACTGQEA
ncbi:MAG: thiamine pyrophosphate-dependent enzyme, partial [Myxococcota bacterium]